MNRIELITKSLRCFVLGLLGLIPILGIPASAVSLVQYWQVTRRQGMNWNPASAYLNWGLCFAIAGLLTSFVIAAAIGLAIVNAMTQSY